MTQVTVHVTEEHILNGIKGSFECCPVALAIQDVTNATVCVGESLICIWDGDTDLDLIPEPKITKFIIDFDDFKRVYPFDFEIDVPEEILA